MGYKTYEGIRGQYKKSCACGCGELVWHIDKSGYRRNYKLGHNGRGVKRKSPPTFGETCHWWKGGRRINHKGYIQVRCVGHPRTHQHRGHYIFEHTLVMEKHLGRYLGPHEIVHHINGIKTDNRIENLQLMRDGDHSILHHTKTKTV